MMTARLTRLLAAVFLIVGGVVHYDLWRSGYRFIPDIGPLFLANFVGSIALAAAVMTSRRGSVAFAGIAFAAGSLVGVLGFTETVWTSQAIATLISEAGAIVTLGFALVIGMRTAASLQPAQQLAPRRRPLPR